MRGEDAGAGSLPWAILHRTGEQLPDVPPPGYQVATGLLTDLLRGADDTDGFVPTRRHIGVCRLCGQIRQLTFEHIPPAAADNARRARGASSWTVATSPRPLTFPRGDWFPSQRGVGGYVLCGPCNHTVGARFVPAYAALAREIGRSITAHAERAGHLPGVLDLQLRGWELGDVARAALVSLMGVAVHGRLLARCPDLSEVVLSGRGGLPSGLRLGLTVVLGSRGRLSAPICRADDTGCAVFAEVALQPFAWTLGFTDPPLRPLPRTADVSHWLQYAHREQAPDETTAVPVGALAAPLPGDYRPANEIATDMPDADQPPPPQSRPAARQDPATD